MTPRTIQPVDMMENSRWEDEVFLNQSAAGRQRTGNWVLSWSEARPV
jgi:hypothetical protein